MGPRLDSPVGFPLVSELVPRLDYVRACMVDFAADLVLKTGITSEYSSVASCLVIRWHVVNSHFISASKERSILGVTFCGVDTSRSEVCTIYHICLY